MWKHCQSFSLYFYCIQWWNSTHWMPAVPSCQKHFVQLYHGSEVASKQEQGYHDASSLVKFIWYQGREEFCFIQLNQCSVVSGYSLNNKQKGKKDFLIYKICQRRLVHLYEWTAVHILFPLSKFMGLVIFYTRSKWPLWELD